MFSVLRVAAEFGHHAADGTIGGRESSINNSSTDRTGTFKDCQP